MTAILLRLAPYLIGAVGVVALVVSAYWAGKSSGETIGELHTKLELAAEADALKQEHRQREMSWKRQLRAAQEQENVIVQDRIVRIREDAKTDECLPSSPPDYFLRDFGRVPDGTTPDSADST